MYEVKISMPVVPVDDTHVNVTLRADISQDGVAFYSNSSEYFNVASDRGDKATMDNPLGFLKALLVKMKSKKKWGQLDNVVETADSVLISGLSYREMVKVERKLLDVLGELMKIGEEKAKHKN